MEETTAPYEEEVIEEREESFSLLEYARHYGIAINHLEYPSIDDELGALKNDTLLNALHDESDQHLTQFDIPVYDVPRERLQCGKAAAILLSKANGDRLTSAELNTDLLSLLDVRKIRDLRVELPLLRSDHATDCREWAKKVASPVLLEHHNLPEEILNNELDEGLGWPTSYLDLPHQFNKKIEQEKIVVDRSAMLGLAEMLQDNRTQEDQEAAWEIACPYKRKANTEPITPPLSPLRDSPAPFIPSSPSAQIPFASDPVSLLSEDIHAFETPILQNDSLIPPTPEQSSFGTVQDSAQNTPSPNPNSPSYYIQTPNSAHVEHRMKIRDLRVEVPLMPTMPSIVKKVTFEDEIEQLKATGHFSVAESPAGNDSTDSVDELMAQAFDIPAIEASIRLRQQETLQEADTTQRVTVPNLDSTRPDPPWAYLQQRCNAINILDLQKLTIREYLEDFGMPRKVPIFHKLQMSLRWNPFSSDVKETIIEESLGDDEHLAEYLTEDTADKILTSADLTWKREGLRILNDSSEDGDDEGDIECADFEEELVRNIVISGKRQREHDESNGNPPILGTVRPISNPVADTTKVPERSSKKPKTKVNDRGTRTSSDTSQRSSIPASNMLNFAGFSVSNALNNLIQMQGLKKKELADSSYFEKPEAPPIPVSEPIEPTTAPLLQTLITSQPMPLPKVTIPSKPTYIVISTSIMKRRSLMRTVAGLFPSMETIERDFSSHNSVSWTPNKTTRVPVISALSTEADIIPCASTGIILTTIHKLRQKPLPNQSKLTEIRERVLNVSAKYEKLILLVSQTSTSSSTRSLDDADCLAVSMFTAFCATLPSQVCIHYIPSDNEDLARFLVQILAQESASQKETLIQDETHWELCLRRAGMNAFAAQAVSARLKCPEGVDGGSPSKAGMFGITKFVEMSDEERKESFGGMCGGTRVLGNVGEVFEMAWRG